jgi:hypothetical protein
MHSGQMRQSEEEVEASATSALDLPRLSSIPGNSCQRGTTGLPSCTDANASPRSRYLASDDPRPSGPASAPREGPCRRPLPRAARRSNARSRRTPLARALQPRVSPSLRRDAAPVSPHPPDGTCGCTATQHRPYGGGYLSHGGATQRRVVHDDLRPDLWNVPDSLPSSPPACRRARSRSDLRAPGLCSPRVKQFWRRQPDPVPLTSRPTVHDRGGRSC